MSDTVLEITTVVTELVIGDGQQTVLELGGPQTVIEIFEGGPQTVLEINESRLDLLTIGVQGLSGVDGTDGIDGVDGVDGDLNYVHNQIAAASVWNVVHNLGKYPSITVIDTANTEVEGDVNYIDQNTAQLTFSAPFSGKAHCN